MSLSRQTRLVSLGRPEHIEDAPVNTPVVLTSTYVGTGPSSQGRTYGRFSNPTWESLEQVIGDLEEAHGEALIFSSGMAAVAAAFSTIPQGTTLFIARHTYPGSVNLAQELAEQGRLRLDFFDAGPDGAAQLIEAASTLRAAGEEVAIWAESPTNPMLEVTDLRTLGAWTSQNGVLLLVDNTFATPLLQRPLIWGADLVMHSATKYLSGHSDVVMGAVAARTPELREKVHAYRSLHGAIVGPLEALIALRGVRTLGVRLQRSQENALELARRLAEHPLVERVAYPGLEGDPHHALAAELMDGFGSIVSVVPAEHVDADAFVRAVRLWIPATSLGGVESTLERRHRHPGEAESVPVNLIRLSVGIEDAEDLWEDLEQALSAAAR